MHLTNLMIFYLKAQSGSIEVYRLWTLHVLESLSEGTHLDLLPLPEGVFHILLPDALNAKVLELYGHVVIVHMHHAHTSFATVTTNLKHIIY